VTSSLSLYETRANPAACTTCISACAFFGQEKEKKKAAQRKEEEREKWWRGAELWMDLPENIRDDGEDDEKDDEEGEEGGSGKAKAPSSAEMELVAKQQALLRRYSNDYSR
jgi:hypothetical protein